MLISVVNSDPELGCSGRAHNACFSFFSLSKKLKFNHPALSKVTVTTTINEIVNVRAQPLSAFIHSVFCLTTGPKPPPKRFLHIVRSRASSFK
jgi:hypothetical protein